jgi:hypothetical protein
MFASAWMNWLAGTIGAIMATLVIFNLTVWLLPKAGRGGALTACRLKLSLPWLSFFSYGRTADLQPTTLNGLSLYSGAKLLAMELRKRAPMTTEKEFDRYYKFLERVDDVGKSNGKVLLLVIGVLTAAECFVGIGIVWRFVNSDVRESTLLILSGVGALVVAAFLTIFMDHAGESLARVMWQRMIRSQFLAHAGPGERFEASYNIQAASDQSVDDDDPDWRKFLNRAEPSKGKLFVIGIIIIISLTTTLTAVRYIHSGRISADQTAQAAADSRFNNEVVISEQPGSTLSTRLTKEMEDASAMAVLAIIFVMTQGAGMVYGFRNAKFSSSAQFDTAYHGMDGKKHWDEFKRSREEYVSECDALLAKWWSKYSEKPNSKLTPHVQRKFPEIFPEVSSEAAARI